MGFMILIQQIDCNHLKHTRAKPQGTLERIHTLASDKCAVQSSFDISMH